MMLNLQAKQKIVFIALFFFGSYALQAQTIEDYSSMMSGTIPAKYTKKQKRNSTVCNILNPNRSYDGSCNNMDEGDWGKAENPFMHEMTPAYGANDGMGGQNRKSAREISNLVAHQDVAVSIPSQRELSTFVFSFFQFIDHNITATHEGETEFAPIPVPAGDPWFDPFNTGTQIIPFTRSAVHPGSSPRQQTNALSSWVDAAGVYGADATRASWLRTFQDGKLKTSTGNLLPCNTLTGECNGTIDPDAPFMAGDESHCGSPQKVYVAGDFRANEQPGLLAIHTLFVREHNRICDELVAAGMTKDEDIYQRARKIVSAKIQQITYNELLPALGIHLDEYKTYKSGEQPDIFSIFSTAAFRLGHTMVPEHLLIVDDNCQDVYGTTGCGPADNDCSCTNSSVTFTGQIDLLNAFFHPSLVSNIGIDPILKGLTVQTQQEIDPKVVNALRNFLFGPPGAGGLDLVSLNIQRGRDHGLPDYNTVRAYYLGSPATSFDEITSDVATQNALKAAFNNDINEIDLFIGLLAEDHLPGSSLGATLHAALKMQFQRLRDCDRFWFDMDPQFPDDQRAIVKATTLADIVKNNTGLQNLQEKVFFSRTCTEKDMVLLTVENECGREQDEIKVPISAENFTNILQAEASMSWDDNLLEFLGFEDFAINEGTFTPSATGNSASFTWVSSQAAGSSIGQGDVLVQAKFKIKAGGGSFTQVTLSTQNFKGVAGSAPNFDIPSKSRDGAVCLWEQPSYFHISGSVTNPFGKPLRKIEMNFIKDNSQHSYIYLNNNEVFYDKVQATPGAEYEVYPLSDDKLNRRQLSVLDLILVCKHLTGDRPFHSPYQYLAADVNMDNVVNWVDLRLIRKVLIGRRSQFPGGEKYRFFSTKDMPTIATPFAIDDYRHYNGLNTYKYGQDFIGVTKGRVARMGRVEPPVMKDAPISADAQYNTVPQNSVVRVPIVANGMEMVTGYQFTVDWVPGVLEYIGHEATENFPEIDEEYINTDLAHEGKLEVIWYDSLGMFQAKTEETKLIYLYFKVNSAPGTYTDIKINSEAMPTMVFNDNVEQESISFKPIKITVAGADYSVSPLGIKNFPNPFKVATTIQFELKQASEVTIDIYNNLGVLVESTTQTYQIGIHNYEFKAEGHADGTYFCRIQSNETTHTIPMTLMKK